MKNLTKYLSAVAIVSLLSACSTSQSALEAQTAGFGASNHANILAHSITPDPKLKADTYIPADRERVRAAREAYRKGEVKALQSTESQTD